MIGKVHNISFNGIYDFTFPKGTSKKDIDTTKQKLVSFIEEKCGDTKNLYQVAAMNNKIRLVTALDNPNTIAYIFEHIGGEKLAMKYIERNKQEYFLNLNG